jgi:uncharacterized repeat protein (TIGR01451 family)
MKTMKGLIVEALALALAIGVADAAISQAQKAGAVLIKTTAELERKGMQDGKEVVRLVAADRVVPGDEVIYTVEVRNAGAKPADNVAVTNPIPEHMVYVADSAVGPGTDVSYSVDGGFSYGKPEALSVKGEDGKSRAASAADYTHIRWVLKGALKANSTAYARFRAVLK